MKLLFYGNCQLGVLSRWFAKCIKYETISCNDVGLVHQPWSRDDITIAIWHGPNQELIKSPEIVDNIYEAWRQADVVFFQHHENSDHGLDTITLVQQSPTTTHVLVPNLRYEQNCTINVCKYLQRIHPDWTHSEIFDYVTTKPPTSDIVDMCKRNVNRFYKKWRIKDIQLGKIYDHVSSVINLSTNVADEIHCLSKTRFVASSRMHPTSAYFEYILEKLRCISLEPTDESIELNDIPHGYSIDPREQLWFRELYPNWSSFPSSDFNCLGMAPKLFEQKTLYLKGI